MTARFVVLFALSLLGLETACGFEYCAFDVVVSNSGSNHVFAVSGGHSERPLADITPLSEKLARLSADAVVVLDIPSSFTVGELAEVDGRIVSAGLHNRRFYVRNSDGAF